jgi:4-diphosphocytidyl-2-C-methyl-D-erythritol kinase
MSGADRPWPAPAKLNLFLHVVGRRADGYHELQTLFQFVDLCDEIHIGVRADGEIRLTEGAPGVPAESDLCVRAARALKTASGSPWGADIRVVKRIPMGGGMGGGSSDAATCLVALNRLWDVAWGPDQLAALGLTLGADVPVFVRGRAAFAEGVGERLTPLYPPLAPPETNYLIIKPNISVSTRDVFQDPELTRDTPRITIHGFLASGGGNDCLAIVRRRYPEVARAMEWLAPAGEARLTGTGSCVFAVCEAARARELLERLPPEWHGYSVRGLNDSPLLSRSEGA